MYRDIKKNVTLLSASYHLWHSVGGAHERKAVKSKLFFSIKIKIIPNRVRNENCVCSECVKLIWQNNK